MELSTLVDRLLRTCHLTQSDCWESSLKGHKYAQLHYREGGLNYYVFGHRISFEFFRAEIPAGLVIDHLCLNKKCVNPWHLEPVTQRINVIRGGKSAIARNALATHCKNGHPFDEVNTARTSARRRCRTCAKAVNRRIRDREAAKRAILDGGAA